VSSQFLFISPQACDPRLAFLLKLGDDLRELLIVGRKKEWLRQINARRTRFGAKAREDVGDINRDYGASTHFSS
jgi:hypothetical protein